MSLVGVIANPSAGKDIRRLVAHGRVVSNQEKVNILRRVLLALDAAGVERVLVMPDPSQIGRQAVEEIHLRLAVETLDMPHGRGEADSTLAARRMAEAGAGCLITLGGDGTNRVVALGAGRVPLVPISTGTNNVFPMMVEGTTAGLAAAVVARGLIDADEACFDGKRIEVFVDGELREIALVDLAVSRQPAGASRAIWEIDTLDELVLTCAEPASIGLSSIGARLQPLSRMEPGGMYVRLGPGGPEVLAPVAPGQVSTVAVAEWRLLTVDERIAISRTPATIALDGERHFAVRAGQRVEVAVSDRGPRVVAVDRVLDLASRRGLFRTEPARA